MENGQSLEWVFWLGTLMMSFLAVSVIFLAVFYQRKVFEITQRETAVSIKAALKAEEKERNRVAADLHDGISGNLSAILNLVRLLEVTEKKEAVVELTKEIKKALETSLNGVQRISYNLDASFIRKTGLASGIKRFFSPNTKLVRYSRTRRLSSAGTPSVPF
ncbi:histidine kinase [Myroides indicus]|uniref:Histidine kinase n=1 Tax=Myroides indicus TaxID=1323422 RepID=A0A4R7EYB0_9FLAO|nr:histidine kinase [Myroides indicus]TDS54607.1 histidine kinase [Myroides indicus]